MRVVHRTAAKGQALVASVRETYGVGEAGGEECLTDWVADADLVINATVKGQSGWRRTSDGQFLVEPYSSLAPAHPAVVDGTRPADAALAREWFLASKADVQQNVREGLEAIARMNRSAACFDLVYSPLESRFLRDARVAGFPTLNGKWMNVGQAADAFARKVLASELDAHGLAGDRGYDRVFEIMVRAW